MTGRSRRAARGARRRSMTPPRVARAPSGSGGVQPLDPEGAGAGADLGRLASSYASGGIPRGIRDELRPVLSDFVYCPESTLDILRECVPAGTDVRRLLDEDWREAFGSGRLRYYEGKVIFPLRHMRKDGRTPIEVSIRHVTYGNAEEKPWYLCYIDNYVRPERQTRTLIPSHELERFAWLGSWEDFLRELAGLALPEPWDFTDAGSPARRAGRPCSRSRPLSRPRRRGRTRGSGAIPSSRATSAPRSIACGSRTRSALMTRRGLRRSTPAWSRAATTTSSPASSRVRPGALEVRGVLLGRCPRPGQARREPVQPSARRRLVLRGARRLALRPGAELIIDYDHVLVDNIGRLPLAFLEEELQGDVRASGLLGEVARSTGQRRCELLGEVGGSSRTTRACSAGCGWRLTEAVDIATKRVRWNFKTAIPSYYPRTNSMNLLLPLCLMETAWPTCAGGPAHALGQLSGPDHLTMRQAYMNARLICRPRQRPGSPRRAAR